MPTDLTSDDIQRFLSQHPSWSHSGESIERTFVFADFNEALGFVVRIGTAAEVADHHPDIDMRWNKVSVTLSTRSEAALTSKDLNLAVVFDTFGC